MKRIITFLLCLIAVGNICIASSLTPLFNAFLQSNLDGNRQAITNAVITVVSVTTTQRLALTVGNGTIVYDSTLSQLYQFANGSWAQIGGGGGGSFTGNANQFGLDGAGANVIKDGATLTNISVAGILQTTAINGNTIRLLNPNTLYTQGSLLVQGGNVFIGDGNAIVNGTTLNVVDQSSQIQANATLGYQLSGGLVTASGGVAAQSDSTFTGVNVTHKILVNPSTSDTAATFEAGASGSANILTIGSHNGGTIYGGMKNDGTWFGNFPTTNFSGSLSGDITGTQGATVVATVGGSTSANLHGAEVLANAATSANTASTIVKRDASGNFTAGTITATLNGNAATATAATSFSGSLAGQIAGTQANTVISPNVDITNAYSHNGTVSNGTFVSAIFQPTNIYLGTNITGVGTNFQNWVKCAFYNGQPFLNRGDQINLNVVDQYWIVGVTNVDATHKIYSVYPILKHTYAIETNVIVSPAVAQFHDDNGNPGMSVGGDGTITVWGDQGTVNNSARFVWGDDAFTFQAYLNDDGGGLGKYLAFGNVDIGKTQGVEFYRNSGAESLVVMPDSTVSAKMGLTNKSGAPLSVLCWQTNKGIGTTSLTNSGPLVQVGSQTNSGDFGIAGNTWFAGNGTPGTGKFPTGTDALGRWTWQALPIATTSALGGVIPDGTTITVDGAGHIASTGGNVIASQIKVTNFAGFMIPVEGLSEAMTSGASAIVNSNVVVCQNKFLPAWTVLNKLSVLVSATVNGAHISGAIYSADGSTKLADTGATALTASTGVYTPSLSATFVGGFTNYIFAFTCDNAATVTFQEMHASGTTMMLNVVPTSGYPEFFAAQNLSTGGAMPTTLGNATNFASLGVSFPFEHWQY